MTFTQMGLHEMILRAVREQGYEVPTPVQAGAIPLVLAGRDLMGSAQTGTGKTAAFALPILHHLKSRPTPAGTKRPIRTLVLAPTRELAAQIAESFRTYGQHCHIFTTVIFGGVGQNPQVAALRGGVDIVVATPGRLLDLMNQGFVDLRSLQHLVLDEADNMLDMGFIHDIRKIITRVPAKRQTLMFSATMPQEIRKLADSILHNPERVQVAPVAATADKVRQTVYFVDKTQKPSMLLKYLNSNPIERVLVFTRTKHGADRVVKHLLRSGVTAAAIHGNKSQNVRIRVLESFKSDRPPVLVATDIAARGLDIDSVSHIVNFDIPNVPETYVHRIGRTARAGAEGVAISFCDGEERSFLRDIEKLTRQSIEVASTGPLPTVVRPPVEHGQHTNHHRSHSPQPSRPAQPPRPASHPQQSQTPHKPQGPSGHGSHAPRQVKGGGGVKFGKPYGLQSQSSGRTRPNRAAKRRQRFAFA